MLQVIGNFATYMFPGGRTLKLVKSEVNLTKLTNLIHLTKNITLTVLDYCAPPPVKLVTHWIGIGAVIDVLVLFPNPITIGSTIHLTTEIYENC